MVRPAFTLLLTFMAVSVLLSQVFEFLLAGKNSTFSFQNSNRIKNSSAAPGGPLFQVQPFGFVPDGRLVQTFVSDKLNTCIYS